MNILLQFVVFMTVIICVEKIIEKAKLRVTLIGKLKKYKHYRKFLLIALIIIGFIIETAKQSLNVKFGKHNIPSIVLGAIMFGIYLKLLPYIFSKKEMS